MPVLTDNDSSTAKIQCSTICKTIVNQTNGESHLTKSRTAAAHGR